jgi:hypothetical protein
MNYIDEMTTSFGEEGMYPPMIGNHHPNAGGMGHQPYVMGMQNGMGDPFENIWEDPATRQLGQEGSHPVIQDSEGNVLVKREPGWGSFR